MPRTVYEARYARFSDLSATSMVEAREEINIALVTLHEQAMADLPHPGEGVQQLPADLAGRFLTEGGRLDGPSAYDNACL